MRGSMTLVPELHQNSISDPIPRRTMATYLDSRQGEFVSGSSLPSSLRFSASRFAFYIAIGVAAVSATGITLARIDVPMGVANASGGRVQTSAIRPAAGISLSANTNSAPVPHPSVVAPVAANPGRSHAAFGRSRIALSAQTRSTEIPDAVKPAIFRLNGKEFLAVEDDLNSGCRAGAAKSDQRLSCGPNYCAGSSAVEP